MYLNSIVKDIARSNSLTEIYEFSLCRRHPPLKIWVLPAENAALTITKKVAARITCRDAG
jgi:hypothetical protein